MTHGRIFAQGERPEAWPYGTAAGRGAGRGGRHMVRCDLCDRQQWREPGVPRALVLLAAAILLSVGIWMHGLTGRGMAALTCGKNARSTGPAARPGVPVRARLHRSIREVFERSCSSGAVDAR